ncbi:hypothetical protein GF323_01200 [Candidatus Woesearchaeota archaeon]|nr:hypothetical protein [Candidatus Woesearchaeota archaeon]
MKKKAGDLVRIISFIFLIVMFAFYVFSETQIPHQEAIYIHHSTTPWNIVEKGLAPECNYRDCDDISRDRTRVWKGLCCDERLCGQGKEGIYYYSYVIHWAWSATGEQGYSIKKEQPPWSPAYFDDSKWICNACGGIWEQNTNNGKGACCGDDITNGSNVDGTKLNIDDPDMGPIACEWCPLGQYPPIQKDGNNTALRAWSTTVPADDNRCCGDDLSDCGAVVNSFLCSDSPGGQTHEQVTIVDPETGFTKTAMVSKPSQGKWYWKDASRAENEGVIWDSLCQYPSNLSDYASYLSDGTQWIGCGESLKTYNVFNLDYNLGQNEVANPYQVLGHDYLCYKEGESYRIVECCAGSSCNNNYIFGSNVLDLGNAEYDGDDNFYTGFSADTARGTYFCREDTTFSTDLDDSPIACKAAKYSNGSSLGYLWTGTLCCSEPGDKHEYYNDHYKDSATGFDAGGACFNSTPLYNRGPADADYPYVKAINGEISACILKKPNYDPEFDMLLALKDNYTQKPLVKTVDICSVDPYYEYYCDYSGEWKYTQGVNRSNLAYVPDYDGWLQEADTEAGCCSPEECWNGSICYPNQARYNLPNEKAKPIRGPPGNDYVGYRCADGQWTWSEPKRGLDLISGYCPRNHQCLVSINGDYKDNNNPEANPQCISSGQYIEDHYCEAGEWSSRTKYLALALIDSVPKNAEYTLYCGPYTDTLNYFDYTTSYGMSISHLFDNPDFYNYADKKPTANNICLLGYRGQLILGASFNDLLSYDELDNILPGFVNCNPVNSSGFDSCNQGLSDSEWVNNNLKSILYSKQEFNLTQYPDYNAIYNSSLKSSFDKLINRLSSNSPTKSFSYNFVKNNFKFDYLYAFRKGNKEIAATLDESKIIVSYENIPQKDICNLTHTYNESYYVAGQNARIACTKQGNSFNIIARGGRQTNIDPYVIWSDLTGKLRPR